MSKDVRKDQGLINIFGLTGAPFVIALSFNEDFTSRLALNGDNFNMICQL